MSRTITAADRTALIRRCGLVAMVIGLIGVLFFIGLLLYTSVAG